jgi:hypothetical protein
MEPNQDILKAMQEKIETLKSDPQGERYALYAWEASVEADDKSPDGWRYIFDVKADKPRRFWKVAPFWATGGSWPLMCAESFKCLKNAVLLNEGFSMEEIFAAVG